MQRSTLRGAVAGLLLAALGLGPAAAAQKPDCPIDAPRHVPRLERAVSLAGLQAQLVGCRARGDCPAEALRLYGLTRIEGYLADPARGDVVLYGAVEPGAPALHLQDFAVALRNVALRYARREGNTLYVSDPTVSIDPRPEMLDELGAIVRRVAAPAGRAEIDTAIDAFCATCERPQTTRVHGIPFDSRFSDVMLRADYLLKRLVNGSEELPGFDSLSDMSLKRAIDQVVEGGGGSLRIGGLTRFWFEAGANRYLERDGLVLIERSEVILLDEREHLTRAGALVSAGTVDPLARRFTCELTRRYGDVAARWPVYRELEGLYRWVALARILDDERAFEVASLDAGFLLDGFEVPRVEVARELPGVAAVKAFDRVEEDGNVRREITLRLPSCGGVSMRVEAQKAAPGPDARDWLTQAARRIRQARPSPDAVHWPL